MTTRHKTWLLMIVGVAAFAIGGFINRGEIAIAGWIVFASAALWYGSSWLRENWRRRD